MIRYYRWAATADASYEAMRAGADLALGLAAPLTSVEAAASAPRDQQSRILLAIDDATAVYAALVGLQGMLASGSVREITAAEYVSSFAVVAATGGGASSASQVSIAGGYVNYYPASLTVESALNAIDGALENKADSALVVYQDDARLSDAREWSASTISQAEAEAGTATTRRAFTSQRVRQAAMSAVARARRFSWSSPNSYMGVAAYGSAESSAVWTIRRCTLSSSGAVTSTATATNVRWTDRLTASYS